MTGVQGGMRTGVTRFLSRERGISCILTLRFLLVAMVTVSDRLQAFGPRKSVLLIIISLSSRNRSLEVLFFGITSMRSPLDCFV